MKINKQKKKKENANTSLGKGFCRKVFKLRINNLSLNTCLICMNISMS